MAAQPDSGLAYTVLIEPDPVGGFTARFPALRGCGTQGDTFEQTLEHAKEALGLYIETLREMGWPLPPDSGTISLKMSL